VIFLKKPKSKDSKNQSFTKDTENQKRNTPKKDVAE
jgi:hypothetical protein